MFGRHSFVVIASLCCVLGLHAEAPVKLQYSTDTPVEMTTAQTFNIDQIIPGLNLAAEGKQNIVSWLTLKSSNSIKQLTKPPFPLEWTLKSIKMSIMSNENGFTFDSSQPQNSVLATELAKWVDHTLQLTINDKFNIERNSEELGKFVQRYPSTAELDPYTFLEGLLLPVFALADQELTKGADITKTNLRGDFGMAFSTLKYQITEITDRHVNATFVGTLEPRTLPLKLGDLIGGFVEGFELMKLSFSGNVEGSVKWDRENALLCQIEGLYTYNTNIKISGMEWPLTVKLKSNLQTAPATLLVNKPEVKSPAALIR